MLLLKFMIKVLTLKGSSLGTKFKRLLYIYISKKSI
jgi:hypothetical protein